MKSHPTSPSRVLAALLLFAAALFPLAAQNEAYGGDEPLPAGGSVILAQELPPPRPVATAPRFLRAAIIPMNTPDSPIRVRFERSVDLGRLRSSPGSLSMQVSKDWDRLRGSWDWISDRELRFLPEAGAVREGDYLQVQVYGSVFLAGESERSEVSVNLSFYAADFLMGNKAASAPVVKGSPRFVAFLDSGLRKIGSGPLYLLYDQEVQPEAVASAFSATAGGNALRIQVRRPEAIHFDREGVYRTANVVAVSFAALPPEGAVVKLRYPDSIAPALWTYAEADFTIQTTFSWSSSDFSALRSGQAARLSNDWYVGFNAAFDPTLFLDSFAIVPRPPVLELSFDYGSRGVYIHAEFDVGKLYSVKLDPAFTDLLGNRLASPLAFGFKSQDLPPVLRLPGYALLLEAGSNRLPVKYRNLRNIEVHTYRFPDAAAYARALADPASVYPESLGEPTVLKIQPSEAAMNALYQADFGVGLDAGLKYVRIRATGRGSESPGQMEKAVLLQTSNLGISAKVSDGAVFAWVTRLDNTAPVAGAKVSLLDEAGNELESGTTASDGTVTIKTELARGSELESPLFLAAELKGDASLCRLSNEELSGAWQFSLPGAVKGVNPLAAALFTERGAYRPGETVHIKAFLRDLPEYEGLSEAQLRILDPRGQEAFQGSAQLDAYRGVSWDFAVEEGASVGEYSMSLALGAYETRKTFRVEEYRVPTFQVAVTSEDADWRLDQPVTLTAAATYLKGGSLGGRDYSWRIYRQPETFAPSNFPGYVFTQERDLSAAGTVYDDAGSLDDQGRTTLSFTPSHPDSYGPMLYIAQAAVTDSDRQNYAGRLSKVVHATDLYVGARPPAATVLRSGDSLSFPFVVVDLEGKPLAKRRVAVYLEELSYEQNTMLDDSGSATTYNREVISSSKVAELDSEAAPKDCVIPLASAGYYRVRLETQDRNGHEASSAFTFTVSGKESVAWPRFDRERIDLVLDKKSYQAGETARVVAQTPFPSARGLFTVEANGVLDRYPFVIDQNTPAVSFPVKAAYAPNAYVSVILLRGRTHYAKDATGFETGAPAYRIGYARLEVDPAAQRLAIAMEKPSLTTSPGRPVKLSFSVANAAGAPTDASAAVMVVDEAVLGLTGYRTPDPIALAYAFRVLAVRNASNLLDLPHARRARFEALFPGGDSDEAMELSPSDDVLRKLFKSTAFFDPAVPVGANGKATVSFTLPDNLTTYRVMVVAANKKGQMGSGQGALLTRKPLSVQPILPRFVYEGDSLVVEAKVFNDSAADGTATLTASFTGFEPLEPLRPLSLAVKSSGSATAAYKVRVPSSAATVKVRFSAVMAGQTDAVEYAIPVRPRGNKQVAVANTVISGSGSLELPLPPGHRLGTVEVVLSQTPLSELKDSVQYLMGYPNGCIEQTTSTAYPLVVLKDLIPAIGVEVSLAELKTYAEAGVARILSFQTSAGGLSYWPGGTEPHAFATAFGLTALIEAKQRGYNVPSEALGKMGDYLEYALRTGKITGEMPHGSIADADTRALYVMTLGRLGRPQPAYIGELWRAKDQLTPFGLAFLAIAVKESKGDQSLLEAIQAEIRKAATHKQDESFFEGSPKGGWSMDSPLRTDAATLVAYAVAENDPAAAQKYLRGLLNRREGGLWGNTQENVFGIMGIYQLVAGSSGSGSGASGSGKGPEWAVEINGKRYPASAFERNSLGVLRLSLPAAALGGPSERLSLKITGPSNGSYFTTLRATYDMPIDTAFLRPQDAGFVLRRSYETMEGESLEGRTVPLGSLVRVRLSLKNDADRHYVAVDDLLPAGFEPVNEALATTATVDLGAISDLALKSRAVLSYQEIRDHRVAFYADELLAGEYEFVYLARATTTGEFFRPIGRAEAMYAPDEYGTSGGGSVTIR